MILLIILTFACCYWITKLSVSAEDKQQTNPLETITKSCSKESGKIVIKESIPVTPVKQCLEQQGQLSRYKGGKKWKEIINNASILISKLLKHSEKKNMPDSGDSNKQAGSHQIPLINRLDVHVLDNMNQYRPSDSPNAAISGAYALENDQDDSFEETQTSVVASASSEAPKEIPALSNSPDDGDIVLLSTTVVRHGRKVDKVTNEDSVMDRKGGHSTSLAIQPSQTRTTMSIDPREAYITDSHGAAEYKPDMLLDTSEATKELNELDFCTKTLPDYREFTFAELQAATHDFDSTPKRHGGHRLGQGSFGVVYYGCMPTQGQPQEIAVKKLRLLETTKPSIRAFCRKQFRREIEALSRVNHPNVIQLCGHSVDGPELCLVYEYIPGGTLAQCLSKTSTNVPNWDDRTHIAQGIGEALMHLHDSFKPPLIHRDIKSSNVLLDNAWNPKLADFGLFCMGEIDESAAVSFAATLVVGTKSYMAPEALKGRVSPKVDVYSYGMILYELITGLPPYSQSKKIDLIMYLREMEDEGVDVSVMVDPRATWPQRIASGYLVLAHNSTNYKSFKRPRMSKIVAELRRLSHSGHI